MLNSILTAEITLKQYLICELVAMALGFGTSLVFLARDKHTSTFSQSLALLPGAVTLVCPQPLPASESFPVSQLFA